MISLLNLTVKEQVYLLELANTVCRPPVELETLNSLKPGVLQFALIEKNLPQRKHRVIEKIINKIICKPQILEGEFAVPEGNLLN